MGARAVWCTVPAKLYAVFYVVTGRSRRIYISACTVYR
jgi:hypothetical protein